MAQQHAVCGLMKLHQVVRRLLAAMVGMCVLQGPAGMTPPRACEVMVVLVVVVAVLAVVEHSLMA